ncbi:MAG: InlB B-repeat-containing protein [Clostridia bacterium]|nr:InlB B-repeat-containing protein [Clostridia bacterium]
MNSGETVQKPIDPQKNKYQFIGWYDSNDVEFDFSTPVTQDMTLYAKWEPTEYIHNGPYVFDGTNFKDTEMHLFSERNIHKNFEISFEISNVAANQKNQATIVNSMEEVSPYPGFVFRIQTNGTQLEFNAPKIANKTGININTTNKIMMKRINDIYYIQVNDGNMQKLGTYSYGRTFDVPLVLGASPDAATSRFFVGTLSDINIRLWESEKYTVIFDANGGTGTMDNQIIRENETISLSANTFENEDKLFDGWNTEPDGSGTNYSAGQSVKNLTKTENGIVDLYAIWSAKSYTKDQYVFDGTDYIDTGVYLFEEGTIDKDFEISFEIVDQTATQKSQATFVNAMDETASPWPGIVYRYNSGTTDHQIGANVNQNIKVETNLGKNIRKVNIKRTNGVIYLKLDDGDFETVLDMSALDKTFHVPLTFGASLTGKGTPQRQFKGTLANLKVIVYE